MVNSLYQQLNSGNNFQNASGMIQKFNEFRSMLQGNPQQIVQQLLSSGRMSQQDYNRYRQMAQEFQQIMRKN